tara:strand:+ start:58 stop:261 length:204 start_codon:yes stop_codon:yes gene_type:complete
MADIKNIALPVPNPEYDSDDEAVTRRMLEQTIEDLAIKITRVQLLQDTMTSKSMRRHQFLLMGAKHG